MLRSLQLDTVREAKDRVPRKTGNLSRSIVAGRITPNFATVEAGANYAAYVELGTRPHIIRPKNASVLAWGGERRLSGRLRTGSSATSFAKYVHHPGTKAQPYLVPGAQAAAAKVGIESIVRRWNDAA